MENLTGETFRFCQLSRTLFLPCPLPSPAITPQGESCKSISIQILSNNCQLTKSIFLFWPSTHSPESILSGRVARSRTRCCGCSPTYSAPTWEPTGTWYWPWHWQSRQYMGTLGVRAYPCIGDGHMPILCSYLGTHGYIQQLYSNDGNRDGDVGAQMIIDKDTQHQLEKTLLAMQDVEDNLKHSFQKLAVEGSVHSTFCAEDIQVIWES